MEAALYFNLWMTPAMMSWDELAFATVHGFLSSVFFCIAAVWLHNSEYCNQRPFRLLPPLRSAMLISGLYVVIYLIAGMYIAIPLGGEAFQATYANLSVPAWMPLVQLLRGMLWALIIWFFVAHHTTAESSKMATAIALSLISSIQLIHPNSLMDTPLRLAHFVEMTVSMAAFGWLAAWIYERYLARSEVESKPL